MPQMTMVSDVLATIHTDYSGVVVVDENGEFVVDCRDGPTMITAGAMYVQASPADRAKARKERQEEFVKANEEFAKSSAEDSKREAILSGVMEPEPPPHTRGPAPVAQGHTDPATTRR